MLKSIKRLSRHLRYYSSHRPSKIIVKSSTLEKEEGYHSFNKQNLNKRDYLFNWCRENVVFQDEYLVAVNKPVWTPQYSSEETVGKSQDPLVSISEILPALKQEWKAVDLQIALPFSRSQSGIMLLTKNDFSYKRIQQYVQTAKIQKVPFMSHIILAIGHPDFQTELEENVVITRKPLEKNTRLETRIIPKQTIHGKRGGSELQVFYKTQCLAVNKGLDVSVLEISCNRQKWYSLETYLLHKQCVTLGDAYNSGRLKTVLGQTLPVFTQNTRTDKLVLPKPIEEALDIDLETDNLPVHIHRHQITLQQFPNKQSSPLVIRAPLPEYFVTSLKLLGLYTDKLQLLDYNMADEVDKFGTYT